MAPSPPGPICFRAASIKACYRVRGSVRHSTVVPAGVIRHHPGRVNSGGSRSAARRDPAAGPYEAAPGAVRSYTVVPSTVFAVK
jgi:hypothetical protein